MRLGPLCVSLAPRSVEDVFSADIRGADSIEVRLDYLENPAESSTVRWDRLPVPVIATCRGRDRGGLFRGALEDEVRILEGAVRNGARYVDIDYRFTKRFPGAGVIASFHEFNETPPALGSILDAARDTESEIVKVATTVRTWHDNRMLFELLHKQRPKTTVVIGMGEMGQITRILGPARGSALTYTSSGHASAPGQLPLEDMRHLYRVPQLGTNTRIVGIIGKPLGHSLSPLVHNRAFAATGLDYVYLRFPVDSLEDFFANAEAIGIHGFSVTLPFKTAVVSFLDSLSPAARAIGAVNTVHRENGKWIGDNTDIYGVQQALHGAGFDHRGRRIAILGAGGAARAAVAALSEAGEILLFARRPEAAAGFGNNVRIRDIRTLGEQWSDLLINATPVGMSPGSEDAPVQGRIPADIVFDMVYTPPMTRLLTEARDQGKTVIGGMAMFLAQAARQFELWTGTSSPHDIFGRNPL